LQTNNAIKQNQEKTNNIAHFITKQDKIKKRYIKMKEKQKKTILSLKSTREQYKKKLLKIQEEQDKVTDLLGNLDILKKKEIKSIRKQQAIDEKKLQKQILAKKKKELAKLKRKRAKGIEKKKKKKKIKELESKIIRLSSNKRLDIKVRNLGSSARGVKILKYTGKKTISPLRSYVITKKFGKYFDSVYKMKLFNESVSLKTKRPNAKVFNVFKGEIVYAKEHSGLLDNVVIVKHKNSLHTIYSHLDKISPTIRVGKWIPKGYVVGRINDTLQFQATKNSKYINPTLLFR
jgi:murein DD-endopeptidase MepM/ murein hydrolase activator NlpD